MSVGIVQNFTHTSVDKVNGGNSGHVGNSGQRQFLPRIGPPTPPPVRDAACGGGEAFPPAGVSAAADSLQELLLSGVTHVSGVPPIYLTRYAFRSLSMGGTVARVLMLV